MTSHGAVEVAGDFEELTDYKRDLSSLVIVHDVRFKPKRWSWEVERIAVFAPAELPADISPQGRRWLKEVAARL